MELNIKKTLIFFISAIVAGSIFIASVVFLISQKKDTKVNIEDKLQIIQSEKIRLLQLVEEDNRQNVLNLSNNDIVTEAYINFRNEFYKDTNKIDNKKINLIIKEIQDKLETSSFKNINIANESNVDSFLPDTLAGLCLQATYTFKLKECSFGPNYKRFDSWFKNFISENKYYDVFLIDPKTADIVYTAEKEVDFGNNLNRPYFEKTGIQEVFRKSLQAKEGEVFLSDYKFYKPSAGAAAAFMATPIYKDNQLLFVLALQLNTEVFYKTISNGFKWKESGLGNTGETLLIGLDGYIRNVTRYAKENYAGYKKFMQQNNFSLKEIDLYERLQVNTLIQTSKTKAFNEALIGRQGLDRYKNYLGKEVIGRYETIAVNGLRYVLVTEIEAEEAYKGYQNNITNTIYTSIALTIAIALITLFLSRFLTRPIVQLADIAKQFSETKQKTVVNFKTFIKEINFLFKEFSSMQDNVVENIKDINKSKDVAEASNKSMKKELSQANEIQNLLFPARDKFDFITGLSKPARDLSGDLYDYFEIFPHDTAFVLADISGKGISASLLMSQVIAVFRNQIKQSPDLSSAAKAINETLLASNSKRFLTFVGGIYSRATGELTILNCGHLPVLIMDKNGKIEKIETQTFPLGIQELENKDLIVQTINIKDKSLYCFTDGLLEASYNNRVFDEEAFSVDIFIKKLNLLPFNQRINFIEKEYNSKNLKTKDDLTVLIIKN
jgi:HAMP domain-containing protein